MQLRREQLEPLLGDEGSTGNFVELSVIKCGLRLSPLYELEKRNTSA